MDYQDASTCGKSERQVLEPAVEHPFFFKLLEMFPDICPAFLRDICQDKPNSDITFDGVMNVLLDGSYERRIQKAKSPPKKLQFAEQYKVLVDLFPDADPAYLEDHCARLIDQPDDEFRQFVTSMMDTNTYPTKEQCIKKTKLSAQEEHYTTEFDVTKFVQLIPQPEEYFSSDPNRSVSYARGDEDYVVKSLANHYSRLPLAVVNQEWTSAQKSVLKAAQALDCVESNRLNKKRGPYQQGSCQKKSSASARRRVNT